MALGFLLLVLSATAFGEPIAFPSRTCDQVWEGRPKGDYLYDFQADTVLTQKGNEGYASYLQRLSQNKIERSDCNKGWTVGIFMSFSDKKLLPYGAADLYEMETTFPKPTKITGSTLKTDVIVQVDNLSAGESRRLHMFQSPLTQSVDRSKEDLLQLAISGVHSPIISSELLDQKPVKDRFREFLLWMTQTYPSEHYLIIIWGHGKGWTSQPSGKRANGGVAIGANGDRLDIPSLRSVLQEVQTQINDKIDVLVSDACLMQTVETATELDDLARFIIGSAGTQSYAGLPYASILSALNKGSYKKAREMIEKQSSSPGGRKGYYNLDEAYYLAWTIPHKYKKSLMPNGSQFREDPTAIAFLTGNALETKQMRRTLLPEMDKLGLALLKYISENDDHWMKIRKVVEKGMIFEGGSQDIGQFLRNLKTLLDKETSGLAALNLGLTGQELLKKIQSSYDALNYATVNAVLGTNYRSFDPFLEIGPRGVSIWLPKTDREYADRATDFANSIFYKHYRNWYNFMQALYLPQAQTHSSPARFSAQFLEGDF